MNTASRFLAALASTVVLAGEAFADERIALSIEIRNYSIPHFQIGATGDRFGSLRYVGGFSMTSPDRNFGALSSFRFLDDGERFVAVTDTGFLLTGAVDRDDAGHPNGFSDVFFQSLPDTEGGYSDRKWEVDAESVDIDGTELTVGFERAHRLSVFRLEGTALSAELRRLDFRVPTWELRGNRGFEALARAPVDSALAGARVAITEKSIDQAGNIFGAIVDGPRAGIFTVARRDDFDVTDADFLPDGDLLLLERSYRISTGVKMRIRRIDGESILAGAVLDGETLIEADMGYQIDNMEGLDVFRTANGELRLALVSDDNKSILQRSLYLEFAFEDGSGS